MRIAGSVTRHLAAAIAALTVAAPAPAQDISRGIQVIPDADLVEQLAPEVGMDRTAVLPAATPPPVNRRLRGVRTIPLDGIRIDDGSILTEQEVQSVATKFTGRMVSMEELEELRRQLSLLYFDKGYVNSGLVLPDQDIENNIVRFREVRGELTTIQLTGNDNLRDAYIMKRTAHVDDGPLEINALQTSLQLLEREPMIERVNAQLLPGALPGQGMLRLEVTESRPWQVAVRADNHRSPAVGGDQVSLMVRNRSLTGRGDELTMYGGFADGYGDGFASYSLPLNARGTGIQFYGSTSDSDIVEEPFSDIDIQSETGSYGLTFNQRLRQSLTTKFSVFLGGEIKHNENTLLGIPFSFTYGEQDGETDLTVFYAGFEFAKRFERSVAAVRTSVRRGLHRADATENRVDLGDPADGPDGQFTTAVVQGQYIRDLGWKNSNLVARLTYQHAWHSLLAMEKFPMGGSSTVRGYRENLLVRDHGAIASLEYRVPLFQEDISAGRFSARRVTLAVFADHGASWNEGWNLEPDTSRERISSVGVGLLWNPSNAINASLYWGHALDDVGTGRGDLQDDGIHFSIGWTPWH